MRKIGDHAVVLGASMGGLLAARVLADAYRRVTIVERDPLPDSAVNRKGVPQGRHAHALLPRGAQVLDELFPGLLGEMEADGVPVLRSPREFRFQLGGHLLRQAGERDEQGYVPSRPCLEGHVRDRVRALRNVSIRDRCEVAGPPGSAPIRIIFSSPSAPVGSRRYRLAYLTSTGRRSSAGGS